MLSPKITFENRFIEDPDQRIIYLNLSVCFLKTLCFKRQIVISTIRMIWTLKHILKSREFIFDQILNASSPELTKWVTFNVGFENIWSKSLQKWQINKISEFTVTVFRYIWGLDWDLSGNHMSKAVFFHITVILYIYFLFLFLSWSRAAYAHVQQSLRGGWHTGRVARDRFIQRTMHSLESPNTLICMFLFSGRKLDYLEKTHVHRENT